MPHTYLCFVWHMHQPFYKDLATGEYQLPWTRMHALKDYYGMVKVLEEFPDVHQTFNLVPSMMVQIEEYAAGQARDPFLRAALKPAEDLSADEQEFVLRYFFQANLARMIHRYPRYGELHNLWRAADYNPARARRSFDTAALRDLQVLSQVAWFDEEFLTDDPEVRALVAKERGYSPEDQALMGRKQLEILGRVLPVYTEFAAKGQIELSVTPFYHPILPLLCDSDIAAVSRPNAPLPAPFRYPADAREQIERARRYAEEKLGHAPAGTWPSEGSVSDEALTLAADAGVKWMATDNGVLGATLGSIAGAWETYQPYRWEKNGREMKLLFRDHYLSDLIGFVYSRMDAVSAAQHLMDRIEENCRPILAAGRDALVPVILDGENAWEHYERSGRDFLRELYGRVSRHPGMSAVTVSEALERVPAVPLQHIHPGSWINANFDIWIGFDEDNRAWELLRDARQTYDRVLKGPEGKRLSQSQKDLAYEELLIAEGSDWCWWYGPHHHSENRGEFDKLFRDHLAQVYRALGLKPPDAVGQPIVEVAVHAEHEPPSAWITPRIDGEVSSYFEWMGAGAFIPDGRAGAMHGAQAPVEALYYGSDQKHVYVRLDLKREAPGLELHVTFDTGETKWVHAMVTETGAAVLSSPIEGQCAYRKTFECAVGLADLGVESGAAVKIQVSVWEDGLPVDAVPAQGWIELGTGRPE